ncbi:hypothetical protein [Croceicoccus sp. YJ47]|uniref:hypothetical protein n=1 Tax=Croceicoccus sp. YJ47 TaxID=2798724 RepID=UPI001924AFEF|nr:hypothetical protein [Croceicoccus sp. YJ47]QQN74634.1 hypothetical protein JD971_02415 [Croceicoccus sp. YJ47]
MDTKTEKLGDLPIIIMLIIAIRRAAAGALSPPYAPVQHGQERNPPFSKRRQVCVQGRGMGRAHAAIAIAEKGDGRLGSASDACASGSSCDVRKA